METDKICNTCQAFLPIEYFGEYQIKGRPNKLRRHKCKQCRCEETKQRYKENPDVKEKMIASAKDNRLLKTYGITQEYYNLMLEDQNGKCAICGIIPARTLNIDHCHSTGKVRGLLCWDCNTGLGKFRDSVNILSTAIIYLENSRNEHPV